MLNMVGMQLKNKGMEQGVKGVIFDWAGTTVDFGCMASTLAFVDVFKLKDIIISIDEVRTSISLTKRDHIRTITELDSVRFQWHKIYNKFPDEVDVDELYNDLEPSLSFIIRNYSAPVKGTAELVSTLKNRGIKVGATTGYVASMMANVIPIAQELGFEPDCIINSSDVDEGIPKPWMSYMNAIKLGVYPMSSLIKIGDTVVDMQEGNNAGMWTIGVTKSGNELGYTEDELLNGDPNVIDFKVDHAKQKLLAAGAHFVADGVWDCLPIIDKIDNLIRKGLKP